MRGAGSPQTPRSLCLCASDRLLLARRFAGRECDLCQAATVHADPRVLRQRVLVGVAERLVTGHAVLITARDLVALLIGEELLDRVGLLDVGDFPVADRFPRGVRVRTEDQLA